MFPDPGLVSLESVLCTEELQRRPPRPPDHASENRALVTLANALADAPDTLLQTLAETILEGLHAGSAGVSLLTADGKSFHWPAIAGQWKAYIGGGTPRDFGPSGDVLDRDAPLLFRHFERRYAYLLETAPMAEECLMVPFHVGGKAAGTIWAMAHDERRRFDAEDLRQLRSIGRFAAAAYRARAQQDSDATRRAALNLMEDAVQSREKTAALNADLRESERRLRELIDALPAAVYTTDATGVVTHYNPAAAAFAGRRPEIGADRWCVSWKLYRADGTPLPHELCPMAVALTEDREVRGEQIIIERPDGTRRWLAPYPTPLHDAAGRIVGGVNMLVDITDSKQAELALRVADQRKNEFLAMLAHELRNPLAPIRNAVEILQRAAGAQTPSPASAAAPGDLPRRRRLETDPAVRSAVQMIERQVGQMVRLVDDLLDVSRISRGRIELRRSTVDLAALMQQAVEAARPLCESAGNQLTVALPNEPVLLDADPARLAQIVGNLLHNACKFTPRGGRIDLSAEVEPEAAQPAAPPGAQRRQLVVRVRDNGIGIAADQLERVFQMFTQVDSSVARSSGGLGIGLALVKDLAGLHDGTVAVHSAGIGHGSEFVLRLPIVIDAAPAQAEAAPAAAATTAQLRILVVDDNLDAAESLALLLEMGGHQTRLAHDGMAAVEAAAKFRPDVVLLDIGLPKLDGYEAGRRIRAQNSEGDKRPLLVALTGWGQDEDRRRSAQAGFDAHLVKPVDTRALMKLLG